MWIEFIVIIIMIFASAFFSGTETAFASVNPARLKNLKDDRGKVKDKIAFYISEHYDSALATILIGNNFVNNAASSVATVIVIGIIGESYSWVATISITVLVLIFGEILPKTVAKNIPEKVSGITAWPIFILHIILRPVVLIIDGFIKVLSFLWKESVSDNTTVSEDDLENMLDIAEDEGILEEEQCDLIQNALDFDEVLAYEVITPRVDMEAIDIRDSFSKNLQILFNTTYSRIPVYEDTPDKIVGILHLNKFYKELAESTDGKVSIRSILSEPIYVHKTMALPDVLDKMREEKKHMAIVLDEYGGTMGIITMEDILEQLVGEIWDEYDEVVEEFVRIDETHYEAIGDMRIDDFFDEFDIDIDEADYEDGNVTLGGWATDELEGEVEEGKNFLFQNLSITVISYDNMRIERLGIEVVETKEEETDEQD